MSHPTRQADRSRSGHAGALDMGGIANLLGSLKRRLEAEGRKITAVQQRLIIKRIEREGVDLPAPGEADEQLSALAVIVAEVLYMGPEPVEALLEELA